MYNIIYYLFNYIEGNRFMDWIVAAAHRFTLNFEWILFLLNHLDYIIQIDKLGMTLNIRIS